MEDYIITDIIEIECDDDGYLNVKFRIEGDDEINYREIETDEYFYWAEANFIDNDFIYDAPVSDEEEEIYTDIVFNFNRWKEYEHDQETVIKFIQDTYRSMDELPELITNKN